MKNKISVILILLFLAYTTDTYSQFLTEEAELPSEVFGKNTGIGEASPPDMSGLAIRSSGWRPDPEEGDESSGGVNSEVALGDGIYTLLFMIIFYMCFIWYKQSKYTGKLRKN